MWVRATKERVTLRKRKGMSCAEQRICFQGETPGSKVRKVEVSCRERTMTLQENSWKKTVSFSHLLEEERGASGAGGVGVRGRLRRPPKTLSAGLKRWHRLITNHRAPWLKDVYPVTQYADDVPYWTYHAELDIPNQEKYIGASAEGFTFDDPELALIKCLGEAVERYACFCPTSALYAKVRALDHHAPNAVHADLKNLEYFSVHQRAKLQLAPLDSATEATMGWYLGSDLRSQQSTWIPAQLVDLTYHGHAPEPLILLPISTGAASHFSLSQALDGGIAECIERDAVMLAYLSQAQLPELDVDSHPRLRLLHQALQDHGFELHVLDVTTDFAVPTYWAICIDGSGLGPALTVGSKCDPSALAAAEGAILEALHPRMWLRGAWLDALQQAQPKGSTQRKKTSTTYADMNTLVERGLFWATSEGVAALRPFWEGARRAPLRADYPTKSHQKSNSLWQSLLEKFPQEPCWAVDLTPVSMKGQLWVVKVIMPRLQPLYLQEAWRAWGSARLREVPAKLGWCSTSLNEGDLVERPHPFL